MIRFLTGLGAGLALAYLSAPRKGKEIRSRLVNLTNDELQGVRLLSQQVPKTVARAKQAWQQIKTYLTFSW